MRISFIMVNPTNRRKVLAQARLLKANAGVVAHQSNEVMITAGYEPLANGQPIHVSVAFVSDKQDRLVHMEFDRDAIEKMLTALVDTEKMLGREPVGVGAPRPGYQTLNMMPTDADALKDLPKPITLREAAKQSFEANGGNLPSKYDLPKPKKRKPVAGRGAGAS